MLRATPPHGRLFAAALLVSLLAQVSGKLEILGAGASFPVSLYHDVMFAYQFIEPNVSVSYLATGSSKGKCRIKDFDTNCDDDLGRPYVDFAGSDSLLKAAEYEKYPDLQMLPTVAGSIVPVVNIPGLIPESGETLIVDRAVLSRIFMGFITTWNDPEILAQQSDSVREKLRPFNKRIVLCVRADGSGSTEVFTKALDLFSGGEFNKSVGAPSSKKSVWDGAKERFGEYVKFEDGTSSLSAAVLRTNWSIGYLAGDAAADAGLQIAAFRQSTTQSIPVTYGTDSVSFAMLEKGLQFGNNGDDPERMTADLMDARGGLAWPISTYTYVIFRDGMEGDRLRPGATCENVIETLKFWHWFYTSELASQLAAKRFFVSLPELVQQPILTTLRSIKCDGEAKLRDFGDLSQSAVSVKGVIDGATDFVFNLYSLSFQAVDEFSRITYNTATNNTMIEIDEGLEETEAFKVVVGNDVYEEGGWARDELAKVLTSRGTPTNTPWNELHEKGDPSTMVLPWFAFAIEFYANIPEKDNDLPLVVTKENLGLILDGDIATWKDSRLVADNAWLDDLPASHEELAIELKAYEELDTVHAILATELSNGFSIYDNAQKFRSYSQAAIVASGSNGSFVYTTSMSSTPSSLTPLSLKWSGSPTAVAPSSESRLACVRHSAAFEPATQAFVVDESVTDCYPLMQPVNLIFHHSFADNEDMCYTNEEEEGDFGVGLPAVRFVKWIFESGDTTEAALTARGAVPLTHASLNEANIAAVLHIMDTINCGHAPDEEVMDWSVIIISCSVGGSVALCLLGCAYYVITTRNEMKSNPLKGMNVKKEIKLVMDDIQDIKSGNVATYIPELGIVPPDLFAIAIVTTRGKVYSCGDIDHLFSIQSMVKPFSYAYTLDQNGVEFMKQKVGVEPAGGAFDTIEMNPDGLPFNPYINAGAIAVTMQMDGNAHQRYSKFKDFLGGYCNRKLTLDEKIYQSESGSAARNREIAEVLVRNGVCANEFDKEHGLEAYFMQCSTLVNCVDLAKMAATCANNGTNPVTKKQVVPLEINEEMMSVMMTCGMYNGAGNWMVDVGIPAKSGVSGGIFGVVPGVCGLAVFSPRLNSAFNSVRGIEAFRELSQRMGLHVLQKRKGGVSFMAPFVGRKSKMNAGRGSSIAQSLITSVPTPHPKKASASSAVAPDLENQASDPRTKCVKVTPRSNDSPRGRHGATISQDCVVEAWGE